MRNEAMTGHRAGRSKRAMTVTEPALSRRLPVHERQARATGGMGWRCRGHTGKQQQSCGQGSKWQAIVQAFGHGGQIQLYSKLNMPRTPYNTPKPFAAIVPKIRASFARQPLTLFSRPQRYECFHRSASSQTLY